VDVNYARDVRDLLVNNNSEVQLVVQAENGSGFAGFVGMGLRMGGQPRNITIKRRSPGEGASPAAHRSPNVDETALPAGAQEARALGRTLFREAKWLESAAAFSEAIEGCTTSHTLYTNRALCNQKLQLWSQVESDALAAIQ